MAESSYFPGQTVVTPKTVKQARALIGKKVTYLQYADIDKSERGYFFPRHGVVAGVHGRNIAMDEQNNYVIYMGNLVVMVLADEPKKDGETHA